MTIVDEEQFANQSIKLLQSIADNIGREEFCTDDVISFGYGRGQQFGHQHLKYLIDHQYIEIRKTGVYAITDSAFAHLS